MGPRPADGPGALATATRRSARRTPQTTSSASGRRIPLRDDVDQRSQETLRISKRHPTCQAERGKMLDIRWTSGRHGASGTRYSATARDFSHVAIARMGRREHKADRQLSAMGVARSTFQQVLGGRREGREDSERGERTVRTSCTTSSGQRGSQRSRARAMSDRRGERQAAAGCRCPTVPPFAR